LPIGFVRFVENFAMPGEAGADHQGRVIDNGLLSIGLLSAWRRTAQYPGRAERGLREKKGSPERSD
jgi:hypothetical protein